MLFGTQLSQPKTVVYKLLAIVGKFLLVLYVLIFLL
jgi:hypothetical protein